MRRVPRHLEASAASVIGQFHRRRGQGGQDGWSTVTGEDWAVAVVADGVSASPGSEIGARLAARWLAAAAARDLTAGTGRADRTCIGGWIDALTARLEGLAVEMSWPGDGPVYAIADYFLFTVQMAVVDRERYCVAGIGDGIVGIDGEWIVLEAEQAGPTCPMYARVGPEVLDAPVDTSVQVHLQGPRSDFSRLVVATDGCLDFLEGKPPPLGRLVDDPDAIWRPARMQAQLEHLCARLGWPPDDATLAVIGAVG